MLDEQTEQPRPEIFGPATLAAFESTTPVSCLWYIPNSDGFAEISAAVISEEIAADLIVQFHGSIFDDVSAHYPHSGTVFSRVVNQGVPGVTITVFIDGDILVASSSSMGYYLGADTLAEIKRVNGR